MKRWTDFLPVICILVALLIRWWAPTAPWKTPAVILAVIIGLAASIFQYTRARRRRGGG